MTYDKLSKFKEITNEMAELYERKQNDYNDSAHETFERYGLTSFLVRLEDKLNRLYSLGYLKNNQKVDDEKIEDTLLDLANYSIMAIIELDRAKSKLCSFGSTIDVNNE